MSVDPVVLRLSLDEAGSELRRLLTEAVARRMVADVPIGALLSGGVDSSAVVATMARLSPGRVSTFTIGFDGARRIRRAPVRRDGRRGDTARITTSSS